MSCARSGDILKLYQAFVVEVFEEVCWRAALAPRRALIVDRDLVSKLRASGEEGGCVIYSAGIAYRWRTSPTFLLAFSVRFTEPQITELMHALLGVAARVWGEVEGRCDAPAWVEIRAKGALL